MLEIIVHILPAAGVAAAVIVLQEGVKLLCRRYLARLCRV